ncbi:MAG TPA: peptidylprolyl isomerase [Acidobacteriaceae bacterium]
MAGRSVGLAAALVLLCVPYGGMADAQQTISPPAEPQEPPNGTRVTLDRVAAIVNGELVLESDVDAERRFAAFQPFSESQPTPQRLMERLIDRALIMQQMALQPQTPIADDQLQAQLASLRKAIPRCATYHCETDAGWKKFVEDQGFTIDEVRERWRQRMQVLAYIEERFRMGITISQAQIDDYYQKTMLPAYAKEKVTAPAEASISERIREIVLQQQVDKLLDDWLTSLRAQGSVVVIKSAEEAP